MIYLPTTARPVDQAEIKSLVQKAKAAGLISIATTTVELAAATPQIKSEVEAVIRTAVSEFNQKFGEFLDAAERFRNAITQLARITDTESFPHMAATPTKHKTVETIMQLVCEHFNFSIAMMLSHVRTDNLVVPRHIAMVLCLRYTNLSQVQIGIRFKRDHGTVMHAKRSLEARMLRDSGLAETFALLEARTRASVGKSAA